MSLSKSLRDREYAKFRELGNGSTAVAVTLTSGVDINIGAVELKGSTNEYRVDVQIDAGSVVGSPMFLPVGGEYNQSRSEYTDGDATVLQSDIKGGVITAGYDDTLQINKVIEQSPAFSRRTSSIPLITSAQTINTSVADVGGEINCQGYKTLTLFMTSTINTSTNLRIAIMAKHESGGAEEMPLDDGFVTIAGTTTAAPSTAAIYYFEQTEDVDADWCIKVQLDNSIPYIQVRALTGTGTDATIDTLDYVLGY